jgi:hypothetical protein
MDRGKWILFQSFRLVGAVGIEIASLQNKSCTVNGIVPPPTFNCC